MNHALLYNLAIIAAIIVCLVVLKNPLALFALLLLKELPYDLMVQSAGNEEDPNPIGFV